MMSDSSGSPDRNTCRLLIPTPGGGGGAGRPPASSRLLFFFKENYESLCVCVWGGASLAQWEQQQQGGGGDLMCNVASWSVASCHFQSSTCDTWPGRSVAVSRLTSLQSSSSCVHIQTCVICIVFFKTGSVFSSCSLTEQSDRNRQRVTLFRGRIMRVIPGD